MSVGKQQQKGQMNKASEERPSADDVNDETAPSVESNDK